MSYKNRKICATCKHWKGDKKRVEEKYNEFPQSLDLDTGWPDDGECAIFGYSVAMIIHGDAYADVFVDANFGCIRYEPD